MSVPSDFLFWYKAKVVNVVDGDTLDLETDLGFRVAFLQRYRLYASTSPSRISIVEVHHGTGPTEDFDSPWTRSMGSPSPRRRPTVTRLPAEALGHPLR